MRFFKRKDKELPTVKVSSIDLEQEFDMKAAISKLRRTINNREFNLSRLERGHWFEDNEGNVYLDPSFHLDSEQLPDGKLFYYAIHPCVYSEEVAIYDYHPEDYHTSNHFYQAMLQFPWFKNWMKKRMAKSDRYTRTYKHLLTDTSSIGIVSQELIFAMVESGDYNLAEAFYIVGRSCERCLNVLIYKYLADWTHLNRLRKVLGDDYSDTGYAKYSQAWHDAGTSCEFCKNDDKEDLHFQACAVDIPLTRGRAKSIDPKQFKIKWDEIKEENMPINAVCKNCSTCEYEHTDEAYEPCAGCKDFGRWCDKSAFTQMLDILEKGAKNG